MFAVIASSIFRGDFRAFFRVTLFQIFHHNNLKVPVIVSWYTGLEGFEDPLSTLDEGLCNGELKSEPGGVRLHEAGSWVSKSVISVC